MIADEVLLLVACACNFVAVFVRAVSVRSQHYSETVAVVIIKLLQQMGSGSGTILLNYPSGSTMQWGAGMICLAQHHIHAAILLIDCLDMPSVMLIIC